MSIRAPLSVLWSVLLVAGLVSCASGDPESQTDRAVSPPVDQVALRDVVAATIGAGDVKLEITSRARMPNDFDDGVPQRRFSGEGYLDPSRDLAGITYRLGTAPNAAGYFGQADGDSSVFYSEDGFTLTFDLMAKALPDPYDWLRYEVDDFANPELVELGIGQLREIGFSDPRIALALLEAGPEELPPPTEPTPGLPGEPSHLFEVEIPSVDVEGGGGLEVPFQALENLGVDSVPLSLVLDSDRRAKSLSYRLSYPPAPGSKPVTLSVKIEFSEYGLEGDLKPPPEETVADYEEYLGQ